MQIKPAGLQAIHGKLCKQVHFLLVHVWVHVLYRIWHTLLPQYRGMVRMPLVALHWGLRSQHHGLIVNASLDITPIYVISGHGN